MLRSRMSALSALGQAAVLTAASSALVLMPPVSADAAAVFGPVPAAATALTVSRPVAGAFSELTASRVLDTRAGRGAPGPVVAGASIAVTIAGRGGVPTVGVASVAINLTVVGSRAGGYLTAYADGAPRPASSQLNFALGQTVTNLVVVPVGSSGRIRLWNGSSGSVQLIGDVAGYYQSGAPTVPGSFHALNASRLLDTRTGQGAAARPLAGRSSLRLQVTGRAGIPASGVAAVAIRLTVTRPQGFGHLTAYADGTRPPAVSSINFTAGETVGNLAIVPVGANGATRIFNGSGRAVDALADVAGYFLAGAPVAAGAMRSVSPTRLLDTRTGVGGRATPVPALNSLALKVSGRAGLPTSGVSAVLVNLAVVSPSTGGYLTAYPNYSARPATTNLTFSAGQTTANLAMVPVGADGYIRLMSTSASADLLVDVVGYYTLGAGLGQCEAVAPDAAGTNITRWAPVVRCVLWMLGQPNTNLQNVETIIDHESSGDPRAINLWDSNAVAGHPSKGLIQVIQPTFDAYRCVHLALDLYDPAANLYAGLHYAILTYGSIANVPGLVSLRQGGPYKGYIATR